MRAYAAIGVTSAMIFTPFNSKLDTILSLSGFVSISFYTDGKVGAIGHHLACRFLHRRLDWLILTCTLSNITQTGHKSKV